MFIILFIICLTIVRLLQPIIQPLDELFGTITKMMVDKEAPVRHQSTLAHQRRCKRFVLLLLKIKQSVVNPLIMPEISRKDNLAVPGTVLWRLESESAS